MLVRFSEIVWDLDAPDFDELEGSEAEKEAVYQEWLDAQSGLPPVVCVLDVPDDVDVSLQGADLLSDKFGWCVLSFQFAPCYQVMLGGLPVVVAVEGKFLHLYPEGYGEPEAVDGCGSPVFLEVAGGRLRVIVSPDITSDAKRVIIDLEGAREVLRV